MFIAMFLQYDTSQVHFSHSLSLVIQMSDQPLVEQRNINSNWILNNERKRKKQLEALFGFCTYRNIWIVSLYIMQMVIVTGLEPL